MSGQTLQEPGMVTLARDLGTCRVTEPQTLSHIYPPSKEPATFTLVGPTHHLLPQPGKSLGTCLMTDRRPLLTSNLAPTPGGSPCLARPPDGELRLKPCWVPPSRSSVCRVPALWSAEPLLRTDLSPQCGWGRYEEMVLGFVPEGPASHSTPAGGCPGE